MMPDLMVPRAARDVESGWLCSVSHGDACDGDTASRRHGDACDGDTATGRALGQPRGSGDAR